MEQKIITAENDYKGLDKWLENKKMVLLVCDRSMKLLDKISRKLDEAETEFVYFSDFQPNPLYSSVVRGVKIFRSKCCDSIMAIGGGSAIDVAKCIKLYSNMSGDGVNGNFLIQDIVPNDISFLAMPTTAGTGSEATRYAVLYYDGKKQSITSESCIPETVLLDPCALKTLPIYQKKATMCDALCHAIESFWSINSTEESREFSRTAIVSIMENMHRYLNNTNIGNSNMLMAAHNAGKAINITQTTAGHAMCYKITSIFGCAHGHAAILCDKVLYPWMIKNTDKCIDPRGERYLKGVLDDIAEAMGCTSADSGAEKLEMIFNELELEVPCATEKQYEELRTSVNIVRLKNHPVFLNNKNIDALYKVILRERGKDEGCKTNRQIVT